MTLKGVEIVCVKKLAELYESGATRWHYENDEGKLGLTKENYHTVLGTMEYIGAISNPTHTSGTRYHYFAITPEAVQLARQIEDQVEEQKAKEQEKKDIVDLVRLTLRKHPITAWAFIVATAFLALIAAANQVLEFLQKIGWIEK